MNRLHLQSRCLSRTITLPSNNIIVSAATAKARQPGEVGGGGVTYEKNGFGGRLAIDLLQELRLEGDHADEAVDGHQVGEDHQRVHAVPEEPPQRWNEIW